MPQGHAGGVRGGDDGVHTGQGLGPGGVYGHDAGMGPAAAQNLAVQHAGQLDVLDVSRLPRHLVRGVQLGDALADQGLPGRGVRGGLGVLGGFHG